MNYTEYNMTYNGQTITAYVLRINKDLSDSSVTIAHDPNGVHSPFYFYTNAPARDGEEIFAAFNGGIFRYTLATNYKVLRSLVINNQENNDEEPAYYDGLPDVTVKNCVLSLNNDITSLANAETYDFARGCNDIYFDAETPGGNVSYHLKVENEEEVANFDIHEFAKRTLVAENDSNILFICIASDVDVNGICYVLKQLRCTKAINMDGGGSTGCHLEGYAHSSIRGVTDAFLIYRKKNYFINTTRGSLRVRTSPSTDASYCDTIPIHSCAKILSFLGIQSDGYQWVRVSFNGHTGYCQLDSTYYTISGGLGNSVKTYLNTTRLQVVIRGSVVNGPILTRIPVGNRAEILEYLPGLQSDGYQWARVKYGNVTGYAQIDTYNCYTISF